MKEIKRYEVEGYEFTDAEFAAKVEPILKAYPELAFEANGNELLLPFGDDAKIFMSNRGELEIQVVDYNPSMTSREVFELADRGILWEVYRGVQYFTRKEPVKNDLDNFAFLYEESESACHSKKGNDYGKTNIPRCRLCTTGRLVLRTAKR